MSDNIAEGVPTAPVPAPVPVAPPPSAAHSKTRGALAIIVVLGFFGFVGAATFWKAADPQVALVAVGYVSGIATAVVGFYFGSSVGSDVKSDTIGKELEKKS